MNFNKFTIKAQEAIGELQNIAHDYGHQELAPEHLLFAMLQQSDGVVPSLLGKVQGLNTTVPELKQKVVAELQKRIGRKQVPKKVIQAVPVRFIAFDLLEDHGKDVRDEFFSQRKLRLSSLINSISDLRLQWSHEISASSWAEFATIREHAREEGVEGFMIKRLDSPYCAGRRRGDWWQWKVDPLTVDAVLIYAQSEHGRRSGLYTDYTFAVWHGETLVPFAKAYSGLTDAEIREVDRFIKQNTIDRFGPVRSVKPELVFEIAFEGIQKSTRRKSGVAVRFPRISRWRRDKKKEEADTLETLQALSRSPCTECC